MVKKIDVIAGARPNFVKVAAFFAVAGQFPELELRLIHTGQHYDYSMSDVFFQDLSLPKPICSLGVGSASHAVQTAKIMKRYEKQIMSNQPDYCLVVGDVNSTLACALVASKLNIPVAHVEAGLRSFDKRMPEEINRIVTDSLSNFLFVTEPSGVVNLKTEGHLDKNVYLVGHVMVDTLLRMKEKAKLLEVAKKLGINVVDYTYVTLHRPVNVDDIDVLREICNQLIWLKEKMPVIFPLHPRTRQNLIQFNLYEKLSQCESIFLAKPFSYLESLNLLMNAKCIATDSGGMQEEATVLGIPCLTLRDSTERPITIKQGTNTLIKYDWKLFREKIESLVKGEKLVEKQTIHCWDGMAATRILQILKEA